MANTEKTGVKFTAEGIKQYLSAFAKANKATEENIKAMREMVDAHKDAGKAQGSFIQQMGQLIGSITSVVGGITGFARALTGILGKAFKVILAPIKLFVGSLRRILEIAGGILLRDAIRGLSNLIRDLQSEIIRTAASFEQLQVRMEAMISRQARLSGQVKDTTEAFRLAEIPAQNLLRWVRDLSLVAPIDTEVITNVLTMAMTMNQTTQEAKDLTSATLRFTTAMGFSSEVSERIIINLLQMERQGKITGRELTDLARGAMVPTNDILRAIADSMGIAGEKWNQFIKDVKAGRIPVEEFMTSFIDVIERDFPEAFERMGKTLSGAVIRLRNFAKGVIALEAITPVAEEIGKVIGTMVDRLNTEEVKRNIAAIGEVLRKSFLALKTPVRELLEAMKELAVAFGLANDPAKAFAQIIINIAAFMKVSVDRITSLVRGLTKDVEEEFSDSADEAESWGRNFIISLARGMAAATSFVLQVIAVIGNILKEWFAPGSPPKIAPDMDDWGASAMTEFLEGFLKADFSVFNEISGVIESFMRSLPASLLAENQLIPSIIGSRSVVADVIGRVKEFGKVTESMVNRIVSSIPNATNAFRKYVRTTLKLADAQQELDDAQKEQKKIQTEINDINTKYGTVLDDLNKKLRRNTQIFADQNKLEKINAALATGRLTDEEKARLEAEKRDIQLREQIRTVEDQRDAEVSAKEDTLAAVTTEMQEAQKRVDLLKEQQSAQKALIGAQTEHNNLLKEYRRILSSLGGEGDDGGLVERVMAKTDLSQLTDDIPEFDFEGMFETATENIDTLFDDIGAEFSDLQEDIATTKEAWDGFFGREGTGTNLIATVKKFSGRVKTAADVMKLLMKIRDKTDFFSIINPINLITDSIDNLLESVNIVKESLPGAWEEITGIFEEAEGNILDIISGLGEKMLEDWGEGFDLVIGAVKEHLGEIKEKFITAKDDIVEIFGNLWDKLVKNSIIPNMMKDINKSVSGGLDNSRSHVKDWANSFVDQTQMASQGISGAISAIQRQSQMMSPAAMAHPSTVSRSRTTNVTVNANYQNSQSPADVRMDVQAALVASQL